MRRILLVTTMACALLASAAALRPARSAVDARDASSAVTSFGPIVSHEGLLRGEVVEWSPIGSRDNARWVVRLETTNSRRVANAGVRVIASMPEDSTLAPRHARVIYVGRGRYEISALDIDRPGWWNVGLVVDYRGRTDSLAFNLIVRNP